MSDHSETWECKDHPDHVDLRDKRENQVKKAQRDLRENQPMCSERKEPRENADPPDPMDQLDHQDPLDLKDHPEHKDEMDLVVWEDQLTLVSTSSNTVNPLIFQTVHQDQPRCGTGTVSCTLKVTNVLTVKIWASPVPACHVSAPCPSCSVICEDSARLLPETITASGCPPTSNRT